MTYNAPTPVPTPTTPSYIVAAQQQSQQQAPAQPSWNQNWNTAWNLGFNGGANINGAGASEGYAAGQAEKAKRSASNTPSGGGGQVLGNQAPTYSYPTAPDNSQLDALYSPSYDYLNQAESNLNSDYPQIQQDLQNNFDTTKSSLDSNRSQALDQNTFQDNQASQRTEDALAASRRLYSQLNQGYQQRFGGSSSAGQAASEIANVEQQRQQGQTLRSAQDVHSQLGMYRSGIEKDYNDNYAKLQADLQHQQLQAKSDFQNKLLQIQSSRSGLASAKAQASLQALQDLRNQVFAINQQNTQFQQNLALARQSALGYVNNLQSNYGSYGTNGQNTVNGYASTNGTTNVQSGLQVNGANNNQSSQTLTGQITNNNQQPDFHRFPINGINQ